MHVLRARAFRMLVRKYSRRGLGSRAGFEAVAVVWIGRVAVVLTVVYWDRSTS